jgi:hypothetical protein
MGITLMDRSNSAPPFFLNYWNWRTLVEAMRRTNVVPESVVDRLHESFCGHGLTAEQANAVARALRERVAANLRDGDRLLLDGTTTSDPDDGEFHRVDTAKNYSTTREVILRFAMFCEASDGFVVE